MVVTGCVHLQGKLTASAVGQIVGLQSEEIKQIASEYAEKVRNNQTNSDVILVYFFCTRSNGFHSCIVMNSDARREPLSC